MISIEEALSDRPVGPGLDLARERVDLDTPVPAIGVTLTTCRNADIRGPAVLSVTLYARHILVAMELAP